MDEVHHEDARAQAILIRMPQLWFREQPVCMVSFEAYFVLSNRSCSALSNVHYLCVTRFFTGKHCFKGLHAPPSAIPTKKDIIFYRIIAQLLLFNACVMDMVR
jgi:hypothetical protein